MFDLKSLKLLKGATRDSQPYSFVGIQRNARTNELEFWMPLGFEDFPDADDVTQYGQMKKLFFGTYKSLKKFVRSNQGSLKNTTDRGGVVSSEVTSGLTNEDDEPVFIYSKIAMLDNVIESYDELLILSVFEERGRTVEISYDHIDKYLHKAIYLEEDMIYIDEMHLPQKRVLYTTVDLIEMYCYIYHEIKLELGEETDVRNEVKFLAESFKVKYLTIRSSLFSESDFASIVTTLKDLLHKIEIMTAYKDSSFWHFFSAVESFLYGETNFDGNDEGTVWGINGFAQLWQDMCNDYVFKFGKQQQHIKAILYADSRAHSNRRIGKRQVYVDPKWETVPFYFEFTGEKSSKRRYLRPDLVIARRTIDDEVEKDINETFNPQITKSRIGDLVSINLHLMLPARKGIFQEFIKRLNRHANRKQPTKSPRVTFEGYHESDYQKELKDQHRSMRIIRLKDLERHNLRDIGITIVDYKYISHLHLKKKSSRLGKDHKLIQDVRKQLTYELAVQQFDGEQNIENQLWTPYYRKQDESKGIHDMGEYIPDCELVTILESNAIKVFKIDFMKLQAFYAQS